MPSNSPSNPGHCLAIWLWLDWVDRYCQKEISVTISRFTTAVSSGVVFWSSKRTLLAVRRNTLHHDTNNDSHMLNWRFAPHSAPSLPVPVWPTRFRRWLEPAPRNSPFEIAPLPHTPGNTGLCAKSPTSAPECPPLARLRHGHDTTPGGSPRATCSACIDHSVLNPGTPIHNSMRFINL